MAHTSMDSKTEDVDGIPTKPPRTPYIAGLAFTAVRHVPPEPFGDPYGPPSTPMKENWKELSHTQLCYARPPLDGRVCSTDTKSLNISKVLRAQEGAQLVVVNETMVAKIYDPLYYEYVNRWGHKQYVIYDADEDYSREAAAYEELQKSSATKSITPAYYGSWVADIETVECSGLSFRRHVRQVPLILMEYLRGQTMSMIDPDGLSEACRLTILKKVLHADSILAQAGICHSDYCPRNLIVLNLHLGEHQETVKSVEVKVIDFNVSSVDHHPRNQELRYAQYIISLYQKWYPKLPSPIVRWCYVGNDFTVPGWYSSEGDDFNIWLWEEFHRDEQYIPVVWSPNKRHSRPRYEMESEISDSDRETTNSDEETANSDDTMTKDEKRIATIDSVMRETFNRPSKSSE